ncbi:MAG: TIGR02996 domain-containing protein [Deltaproteobacteria bacterium]|nr:TIGR02996 domain-containing protein [Deltaproteobacteria bacterium]
MTAVIEALARAVNEGQGSEQLDAMLAAWRLVPDPRLAAVIAALSRQLAGAPIDKRKAWLAALAAGRPESVHGLVDGFLRAPWSSFETLEMLLRRAPDPRLAAAADALVARFTGQHRLIASLVAPHRLPEAALPSEAEPLLARLVAIVEEGQRREEGLRDDVLADPHDDATRAVYADFLLERGDPRGELIALQLAADPATEARRKQLEEQLFGRCLGRLAGAVTGGRLDRGFVAEARLSYDERAIAARIGAPDWVTVRSLYASSAVSPELLARLLEPPVMHDLEELHHVDAAALVACRAPLAALHTKTLVAGTDADTHALGDRDAFHALARLRTSYALAQALAHSPLARRLLHLDVGCPLEGQLQASMVMHADGYAPACELRASNGRATVTVRRRVLHTHRLEVAALAQLLDALPADTYREVHIAEVLGREDHARLGLAAGRHGGLRLDVWPPEP